MRVIAEWMTPDPNGKRNLSGMHEFSVKDMREAALCAEWFLAFAADQKTSWVSPWHSIRVTIDEGEV